MTREEYNRVMELIDLMIQRPLDVIGKLIEEEQTDAAILALGELSLAGLTTKIFDMVVTEVKTPNDLEEALLSLAEAYRRKRAAAEVEEAPLEVSEVAQETSEVATDTKDDVS